ncbi:MAG: hypothetical protein AAFY71_24560 [Bacteroidota bacterium]
MFLGSRTFTLLRAGERHSGDETVQVGGEEYALYQRGRLLLTTLVA